nr:DUF2971 domain-containing protein [Crenothrix polyspora]
MPDTILRYKYVPVDGSFEMPFDKKGSLSIIKDGTMKFTNRKEFNDPFDGWPEIDVKATLKWATKNPPSDMKKHIDSIIEREKGRLPPAQRLLERSRFRRKNEINFENIFFEEFDKYGICSLSRTPLNLLMWAHYAKDHKGFVIEFSIPILKSFEQFSDDQGNIFTQKLKSYGSYTLYPFPVSYEKEKPVVTGDTQAFDKKFITKGKDWEYEQEERVIDFIQGCGVHPYDRKQVLKSVIAGVRMRDEDFTVLKNTVDTVNKEQGMNVTVHKAEPVKGKFALTVPDRDDLNIHNM